MKNKKLKILLFISSNSTPRIYLVLLKRFIQRRIPEAVVNYFISSHDDSNSTARKSVYAEREKLKKDVDVLIGLDGYLPKDLLEYAKGEKYLLHLPEVGQPLNIGKYIVGYDYLVVFSESDRALFEKKCNRKGVKVVMGKEDPFRSELQSMEKVEEAKKELLKKHPQTKGKKILAITTRGKCDKRYIDKYKSMNLKGILRKLPEDVVLMTNCAQLELAASMLPQKYSEKFIVFGQREMIDVLLCAKWNYTNIGITEKSMAKMKKICYSNNEFEKDRKEEGIKLWKQNENILAIFDKKENYGW